MALYSGEVLRVDASGNLSISQLTIEDTDAFLVSQDAGASFALDGVTLATVPVIDFGDLSGLALDGSALFSTMTHFNVGGFDYYTLGSDTAPEQFASLTNSSVSGIVGGFNYLNNNLSLDHEKLFIGQALVVNFDVTNTAQSLGPDDVIVSDDDNRIQFNGLNGAPNSEAGAAAQVVLGEGRFVTGFNTTNAGAGDSQMVLVEVSCQTATGIGTFEALRFTQTVFAGSIVSYMPRTGSVDLATITAYLGETLLPTPANGLKYTDFGLDAGLRRTAGDGQDNYLTGSMLHDNLVGGNGADSLVGGMGADLLEGGRGADLLYGGSHADTLTGGGGADRLFGGIDDDRLEGGGADDRLFGNAGADLLTGGGGNDSLVGGDDGDRLSGNQGNDTLAGGAGSDVLDGSTGRDTVTGGGGADRFVFNVDGVTDRLADFQNGLDVIDLAESFASLTITTLSAGRVRIDHSGEVLIVTDTAGVLTAADFTADDFV